MSDYVFRPLALELSPWTWRGRRLPRIRHPRRGHPKLLVKLPMKSLTSMVKRRWKTARRQPGAQLRERRQLQRELRRRWANQAFLCQVCLYKSRESTTHTLAASYPDHELDSWRDHLAGRRSAEALFPHLRSTASYAFRKTLRSPRYCCQATSRWNGTGWEEIPMCGEKMSSSESFVRHVKSHLGLCREQTLEEAFTGEQKPLETALDLTVASEGK